MAKLDFSAIKRPSLEPKRVEVRGGLPEPMVLWLRPLDGPLREKANERAQELSALYVTGGYVHPTTEKWTEQPMPFPKIGGEDVAVSERLFAIVARLEAMQKPPEAADLYTAEELVVLAALDGEAWQELQAEAAKVGSAGKA